jgi:hypothetical protein
MLKTFIKHPKMAIRALKDGFFHPDTQQHCEG